MMKCEKKIAVLLATYNGERYLPRQIDSLLNQTYQDFNIYIHDDGSKDNTYNIICDYCLKYPNKIFCLNGDSTGGARNNFFYLMNNVEANYYMLCDQDDFWKEDKILKSINAILKLESSYHEDPCLVFTDLEVVDSNLLTINNSMNRSQRLNPYELTINRIVCQNPVTGCTIIMNKKLNEKSLQFKNINSIIMHDWWIALVAARYGKIGYYNESLIKYCQHGDNTVGAYNPNDINYIRKKITKLSDMKQAIENTRLQANEFCNSYGFKGNELIYEFGNLSCKSKLKRICFYIKNRTWKNGLIRNVGFLLLG